MGYIYKQLSPDDNTLEVAWDGKKSQTFKLACCDCGMVHKLAIAVEKNGNLGIAFASDNRATAQRRRHSKFPCKKRGKRKVVR